MMGAFISGPYGFLAMCFARPRHNRWSAYRRCMCADQSSHRASGRSGCRGGFVLPAGGGERRCSPSRSLSPCLDSTSCCCRTTLESCDRGSWACSCGQSWCQPKPPSRRTTDCINRSAGTGEIAARACRSHFVPIASASTMVNRPIHNQGERKTYLIEGGKRSQILLSAMLRPF